jgi:hypothetical protein
MATKEEIRPFSFHAPEAEQSDLRKRINATKWPEREPVTDDSQGVHLATIQKLEPRFHLAPVVSVGQCRGVGHRDAFS